MSNQSPRLDTVMRRAIQSAVRGMRVSLPGRIEAYDAATGQASVQPLVQDGVVGETGVRLPERLPVVTNVPCVMMGGGGSRLTFPIVAGDECVLLFASSAIDRWLSLGGEVDPRDDRHHHITDAFAIVGISSEPQAVAAHATATVLEGDDIRLGDESAELLALKSDLTTLKTAITNTAIVATDGGASFKATLLAALTTWPAGTTKVKGK